MDQSARGIGGAGGDAGGDASFASMNHRQGRHYGPDNSSQ